MQTANGLYNYSLQINGQTIFDLVQELHKYNCDNNGWFYNPLKPGCFGFDNLVICIGYITPLLNKNLTLQEIADLVHQAWTINYIYWRDNKPWLRLNSPYIKASKPLGDKRRNECANTKYSDLPHEEQEKDLIIAKWFQSKF